MPNGHFHFSFMPGGCPPPGFLAGKGLLQSITNTFNELVLSPRVSWFQHWKHFVRKELSKQYKSPSHCTYHPPCKKNLQQAQFVRTIFHVTSGNPTGCFISVSILFSPAKASEGLLCITEILFPRSMTQKDYHASQTHRVKEC